MLEILLTVLEIIHYFKHKSSFFKTLTDANNGVLKNVKIVAPLRHLSNFWRSLEMSLINCKIAGNATFKIKDT